MLNSNVRSLRNKLDDLFCVITLNKIDIAVLTETCCNADIPDFAIHFPGYNVFRNDRSDGRRGGGVMILVHKSIPCKM